MNVNPGELDKKIQIKTFDKNKGESSLVRVCWAKITNQSGSDVLRVDNEIGVMKTRFLIRKSKTNIERDMFIYFKALIFRIVYINNYNYSDQYLEIIGEREDWYESEP